MEILEFFVSGSSGDAYAVKFEKTGVNMNAFCTCAAGQNGIYCKHRFGLMNGDVGSLLSENTADVEKLREMMRGTDLEAAYNGVVQAEKAAEEAKLAVAKAKKVLAKAMYR